MADTRTAMLRLSALVGERTLFESDDFRRLWLARLLSSTPVNAVVYTMLILVVNMTGKSFASSLFVVAYITPSALLGTVSGVMVDRLPKGTVLAATNVARAGLCIMLAIAADNLFLIYVIAVLFAIGSQFSGPAEAAALPAVVDQDDLTSANTLYNLGSLISQVAGLLVLPAVFLKTVGAEALAIVCAAMFVIAAVNFMLIGAFSGRVSREAVSLQDSRERFAEAWHRLTLDSISYIAIVITVLANTTGLVVVTLVPRFSTSVLGITAENAIFVAATAALGIWLALRLVPSVAERMSPWRSIGGSYAALVAGVALLAFVPALGGVIERMNPFGVFEPGPFDETAARIMVTMVLAAWLAFAFTFVNVVGRSVVNERVPAEMQGRIFAAQNVLTNLASIPPILLAGLLADAIGVSPVFVLVAIMCGLLAVFYSARNLAMPARAAS